MSAIAENETGSSTMMFSEEEWETAFKKASLVAIEIAKPSEPAGEEKPTGRYFTDAGTGLGASADDNDDDDIVPFVLG